MEYLKNIQKYIYKKRAKQHVDTMSENNFNKLLFLGIDNN